MSVSQKKIVKKILKHFVDKEKTLTTDYKWWCNNEFDSNVTAYEALNNARQLCIVSKYSIEDVKIINYLLSAILEENYYLMEENNIFESLILESEIDNIMIEFDKDKNKLYSYNNSKIWIKYLKIVLQDSDIDEYNTCPIIDCKYISHNFINFEQCCLKLCDINVDLRITANKIVQIVK